jgi:diguanylate cyclase (GGDEF)-like protein
VSTDNMNPSTEAERSARLASPLSYGRFFLIGTVVVVTIIGAAGAVIGMQRNDAIAAYRTATTNLGNGMGQQTSQAINSVDRVLREIESHLASVGDGTPELIGMSMRSKAIFDLLATLGKGNPVVTGLAIVDAGGVIQNSSGMLDSVGQDLARQDFFVHFNTGDDHNSFVSVPKQADPSGNWMAFLSRRIDDIHGRFAGIVVAEISLASIEEFYSGAMPARRSVSLARADGVVLVRFPNREDEIGKKIPDGTPWYAAVAQGGGAYHARDFFTQTPIVAFVRPLKNLPLVVQASVTEAEVLADWPRQILWIVLGAVTAAIGVAFLLRYLAGQVDRLERAKVLLSSKNAELETTHSQLDAALANISLGVCFFTGEKKLVVSNKSYSDIYNLPAEATRPGISVTELMDYLYASGSFPRMERAEYVAFGDGMVESGERRQAVVELVSGRSVFVTHQPMPHDGWISTHEDITKRREAERRIRFLAHHDVLTGLSNRAIFAEKLEEAVARLRRHGESFTVFMLDLDKFKNVNDTLGHLAGDQLLQETAQRLKSSLRETDVLARLGGDEFAIIQSGKENPGKGATGLATRILKVISEPYNIDGNVVSVGASIGIALAPENSDKSSDILKMADLALYAVKSGGRNDFRFFEAGMLAASDGRRELEDQPSVAMSCGEFELH